MAAGAAGSQADADMLEEPADEGEDPPAPPANEPPQLPLPSEGIPVTGAFQLTPVAPGEADGTYASGTVSSTNFTEEDLAAQESADEAPTAAPAAPTRLAHAQAVGRLLFMSWNAGGGARKLPTVLDELGHHVFAIHEAHADQMCQMSKHNWALAEGQCIAARKPNSVQTVAHASIPGKIYWHVAEILFDKPRLGLNSLVIMSVHLNAKKPVAGPRALEQAIDAAIKACQDAGRPALDIVCGDINMARLPLSSHDNFGRSSGSLKHYASHDNFGRSSGSLLLRVGPCCSTLRRAALAQRCSSVLHSSALHSAAPRLGQIGPRALARRHLRRPRDPRHHARLRLGGRMLLCCCPRAVAPAAPREGLELGPAVGGQERASEGRDLPALPRAVWGEANQSGPQSVFPSNEHLLFGRSSG